MIGFLKNRPETAAPAPPDASTGARDLGSLEISVMEILWTQGEANVRQVVERMERPLAYTTIMTTLDRLYKKGLLARHKVERAFVYVARFSRQEWERKRAGDLLAGFLAGPPPRRELLISCLLEAVGREDEALLEDLERKIRLRRRQLGRRENC